MRFSQLILTGMVTTALACPAVAQDGIGWQASGKGGAVASGHADAVAAGIEMLQKGGNAADAAAATLLALTVSDYGLFAFGGEVSLLIYDADEGRVRVLCGLGRAPLDEQAIAWYWEHGIPAKGSMKAAPVPGAPDLVCTLLRLYGTISFEEAAGPQLRLLDRGEKDWHPRLAVTVRKMIEAEQQASGTREAKLIAARDRFYKGDIADELERWYIDTGSFLRKRDLEAHKTTVEDPVSVHYRGYTVYKCPTWTQGPYLCQTLQLLEGFPLKELGHLSPDYIHILTEALKLGFADRDQYYADPAFESVPIDRLLSDEYARKRRELINVKQASHERRPGDPWTMKPLLSSVAPDGSTKDIPVQDTTTCVVADRWGNVVAATPSCNLAGNKPGPSGVTQGNRLRCLNTTAGHPNRIEPGKRPRITLTPTIVTKGDKPVIAISVAGGDLQDQTTLNVLLNHIEFGMPPAAAVTAPRFSTGFQLNSFDPNPDRSAAFPEDRSLKLSNEISTSIVEELKSRGHEVTVTKKVIGHPVMIVINPETGLMQAAGDPKAKRHAAVVE